MRSSRGARRGDPAAFGILFARHRDRLWAVALRTCADPEDAADALQEAMIAAFRRAGSYRGDAAVTTWLHRIVVNASLDRLRRKKVRAGRRAARRPRRPRRPRLGAPSSSRDADDPVLRSERAEVQQQVLAALRQLPPEQRAALVLVDMEGYSVEDTAAESSASPWAPSKSRCSRGRARLLAAPVAVAYVTCEPGRERRRAHRASHPDRSPTCQWTPADPTGGGEHP